MLLNNRKEEERKLARNKVGQNGQEIKLKRIMVPVNGGATDDEAIRLAYTYALAKLDRGRNVSVDVVYVVQVPHSLPLNAELKDEIQRGEQALDHAEGVAHEMKLQVEASLLQARSAGSAIVDLARENSVELIVMATGYQKRLGELDLGHTIPYVLKNAPCRVWICRAPMVEDEA